jgi:hypothetical protein
VSLPSQDDLDSLHDAELGTVAIDRANGCINIAFVRVDGSQIGFEFTGIAAFRTSGLLFQNVAYGAALSSINLAREDIERIVTWACSLEDEAIFEGESARFRAEFVSVVVEKVARGSLVLFHVEASVGVEIAVVCETISRYQPSV